MQRRTLLQAILVMALMLLLAVSFSQAQQPEAAGTEPLSPEAALGTAFTYQGQLVYNDAPVNDTCDFTFSLWDEEGTGSPPTGGTQVGSNVPKNGVTVSDGLFTVSLDVGSDAFTGDARWLQIIVDCNSIAGTLSPRQALSPAPYALHAADADLLDGQEGSYYQARASGICDVGSTVRAINADGTVVCQTDAPFNRSGAPIANTLSVLDSAGNFANYDSSVTIGADGLGLISYYVSNGDLKVAHCDDVICSSATLATLDNAGDLDYYSTSVTIGADGLGLISYYVSNGDLVDLKVAHCADITCSSATTATLDSAEFGGNENETSVTIGTDGLGLISYLDGTNKDLKVAHCDDVACSSATTATLDGGGDVGGFTSVTIGADGLGLISYKDLSNGYLKVAHCVDVTCSSATLATLDSAGYAGNYTSVTIGTDGLGLISYLGNGFVSVSELKVAHCDDVTCSSASIATLDFDDDGGFYYISVTIGADGLGLISYWSTDEVLRVAHCVDVNCSSAILATLDSAWTTGLFTSVTIGADGLGLISYYDYNTAAWKVAHCANAFCTPYFRRR